LIFSKRKSRKKRRISLAVYIAITGIDLSQAVRPLVQSFFNNEKADYNYINSDEGFEELKLPKPREEGLSFCLVCDRHEATAALFEGGELLYSDIVKNIDAVADSRAYRDSVCHLIYVILNKYTGKELPWGILVGIRPTKRIYEALEEGLKEEEITRQFREELKVSEERTELSLDIAKRERRLLSGFDYQNGYSLYIGIPFCPTTCLYCSFTSYPVEKFGKYMDAYLDALTKEIAYASTALKDKKLNTIYVGGGTPTALDEKNLERLMQVIHRYFPVNEVLEFSVEAGRPDSINEKKLEILKKYGVTRISINPQSLVQRTLDTIGRRHDVESVYRAFEMARATGHDNINMDLIAGLTGETPKDMEITLRGVEELAPESLTVHTLALKRAARLKIENEKYIGQEATGVRTMLDMTMDYAANHSLKPYYLYRQKNMTENLENVGYALEGRECLYNILIMEERQTIFALGAGASTKYVYNPERLDRIENVKSLTDYIDRVDEMIDRKKRFLEWI
jgi:oxygen-independent coproporphyrinogen-3 oxidase